jgi:hypothetical protein
VEPARLRATLNRAHERLEQRGFQNRGADRLKAVASEIQIGAPMGICEPSRSGGATTS